MNATETMILGPEILDYLQKTGKTRKEFTEMADIPLSTLNSIISGANPNPTILTTIKIARTAEMSLDALAGLTNDSMGQEEILRIQEEHQKYKELLDQKLAQHTQDKILQEAAIAHSQEIIRRQDLRMAEQNKTIEGLEDRVLYQKKAIFIHRAIMAALAVLSAALIILFVLMLDSDTIRSEVLRSFYLLFS